MYKYLSQKYLKINDSMIMNRNLITLMFALMLSASLFTVSVYADVTVSYESEFLINAKIDSTGNAYLPLRLITEKLDYTSIYNSGVYTSKNADRSFAITVGKTEAIVNGAKLSLPVVPKIINGNLCVDAMSVNMLTGNYVQWSPETKTIKISSNKHEVQKTDEIFSDSEYLKYVGLVISKEENTPIAPIFTKIGYTYKYYTDGKMLRSLPTDVNDFCLVVGSKDAYLVGKPDVLPDAPKIVNGRVCCTPETIRYIVSRLLQSNQTALRPNKTQSNNGGPLMPLLNSSESVDTNKIFDNDERLFAIMAFINYTGYDDNNGYPISGIRKMVRDELNAKKFSITKPDFYKKSTIDDRGYLVLSCYVGPAPDFKEAPGIPNELKGISSSVKEFYLNADLADMFKKYRPMIDEKVKKNILYGAIQEINEFDRFLNYNTGNVEISVNPLLASCRGYAPRGDKDCLNGKDRIICGLNESGDPNILNIVHEYAHAQFYANNQRFDGQYNEEVVVRAISTFVVDPTNRMDYTKSDEQQGFSGTTKVFNAIKTFDYQTTTLTDFINTIK